MSFFFVFRNSRFKCVFFEKKRVFLAQEGILFFTTSPGDRTNRPKWTKFGQKLSFRNLPNGFFLFFEICVLRAFFSKKTRFFGSGRHTVFYPFAWRPHQSTEMDQIWTKPVFYESKKTLFFVFRNSRFKCVFSKKNAFFCLRKAYCFLPPRLETAPIDQKTVFV